MPLGINSKTVASVESAIYYYNIDTIILGSLGSGKNPGPIGRYGHAMFKMR